MNLSTINNDGVFLKVLRNYSSV